MQKTHYTKISYTGAIANKKTKLWKQIYGMLEPNKQGMSPSKCIKAFVCGGKERALATA